MKSFKNGFDISRNNASESENQDNEPRLYPSYACNWLPNPPFFPPTVPHTVDAAIHGPPRNDNILDVGGLMRVLNTSPRVITKFDREKLSELFACASSSLIFETYLRANNHNDKYDIDAINSHNSDDDVGLFSKEGCYEEGSGGALCFFGRGNNSDNNTLQD